MAILKDLLVNGNSSLLGTITAVDILPQTDAIYDLGSSTLNWNNIYGTAIKVTAYENTIEIGSKNANYSHIYASLPFAFNLNLVPSTNKGKNLGTESIMWGTIYSSNYIVRPTADAMSETASGFRVEGVVSGNVAKYGNFSIGTAGTTSATGICSLSLGNSILTSLTNNAKGRIFLYGTNTKATLIETTFNGSSAHSIMYFPNHAGPGYLAHTASDEKVGDTDLPVYVAANGRITSTIGKMFALNGGIALSTSSTDLNTQTVYGNYYCSASSKAKTFLNNPYGDTSSLTAFRLTVFNSLGIDSNNNYLRQDLREFSKPTYFTRYTTNASEEQIVWNANPNGGTWAAYAYNPNTASTVGSSSSPIYVDKTGELKACTAIDCGEITTPKIYIYGDKTSNKTNRFIHSDALSNMYFSVDGLTVLVLLKGDTNTVRRGASANATDLGTSSYPWNNIYGNKLIAGTITVGDSTANTTGRTITSSTTLYLNRAVDTSIVFLQAGTNYISIDTSNNLIPVTALTEKLNLGLSANKWKAVYAKDFYGSGANLTNIYVGSVAKTSTATYNTTPEVASIKVGNGTAAAAGANGCTLQYDSTLQTLKFVFA